MRWRPRQLSTMLQRRLPHRRQLSTMLQRRLPRQRQLCTLRAMRPTRMVWQVVMSHMVLLQKLWYRSITTMPVMRTVLSPAVQWLAPLVPLLVQ